MNVRRIRFAASSILLSIPAAAPPASAGLMDNCVLVISAPESVSGSRGDCNQDVEIDVWGGICMLENLFLGQGEVPCSEGLEDSGNSALLHWQQDGTVVLSDGVALFSHLVLVGPAHGLGTECAVISGYPTLCAA